MILIKIMVQQPKLAFIMESTLIFIQSMMFKAFIQDLSCMKPKCITSSWGY